MRCLTILLVLVASTANAQTGVNLATNRATFFFEGLSDPAALGAVDFNFSYTFPGASSAHSFTIQNITAVTDSPDEYITINAGNAATYGIDFAVLQSDYANHRPPYGQSAGPTVSIDTALGTNNSPLNGSTWNFRRWTVPSGDPAPMMLTQLQVRITTFGTVVDGTVFRAMTILSGDAYLAPEPSTLVLLLPLFGLCCLRYHG